LGSTSDSTKWIVASRGDDGLGQAATVDTETGAVSATRDFPGKVLFFEPVQGRVAVQQDRDLVLYDLATGHEQCRLQGFDGTGPRAISPDARRLAQVIMRYGTVDCQIEIWSLDSGRRVATLDGPWSLSALAFSGDGQRLLAHSAEWPGSQPSLIWDATPLPEGE
jgi:WD40 repeat protein